MCYCNDSMDAAEFLDRLFGQWIGPEARLSLFTLPGGRTAWFEDPAAAAEYAVRCRDQFNVYFGVGLYRPGIVAGRGGAADVVCVTSMWADVDYGPGHKTTVAPDLASARRILTRVALGVSLLVNSGRGLHPYWLLAEPCTPPRAEELAKRWSSNIVAHADTLGWSCDSVGDLARVLRVPGTYNHKDGGKVLVEVVEANDVLYSEDDVEAALPVASVESIATSPVYYQGPLSLDMEPPAAKLYRFLSENPRFRKTLDHKRGADLKSASEYDLSLCTQAHQAGWSDEECVALMIMCRKMHGLNPEKLLRRDYAQRTVALSHQADVNVIDMRELESFYDEPGGSMVSPVTPPRPSPGSPDDTPLNKLSRLLAAELGGFVQYGHEDSRVFYCFRLADGRAVYIANARMLLDFSAVSARFIEAVRRPIPHHKPAVWTKIVELLLSIVEVNRDEEYTRAGDCRRWLTGYLRTNQPLAADQKGSALERNSPYTSDGLLNVHLPSVHRWVRLVGMESVPAVAIREAFRAAGLSPARVTARTENGVVCRTYWSVPLDSTVANEVYGVIPCDTNVILDNES